MDQEKDLPQNIIRRVLDTLKGQNVVARRDSDGLYYPGECQSLVVGLNIKIFTFVRQLQELFVLILRLNQT
jgi:DNA-binding IclR family transcriptional regulator